MEYEITAATTEPDEDGMLRVDYRTADGKERSIRYSAGDRTPHEVAEHYIEEDAREAAAANDPPGNFGMFVKMDGKMRPYKPAPA